MTPLERLDAMYSRWLIQEALPDICAVELIMQDFLTDSQRAWLVRFTKVHAQMQQSI